VFAFADVLYVAPTYSFTCVQLFPNTANHERATIMSRCILKNSFAFVFAITLCASVPNRLDAAITAQITPSHVSPALLGTVITWIVTASDTQPGVLWYRFRARPMGGNFHAIKDYSPSNTMDWTETDSEGLYVVEASIRNFDTGETVFASATYEMDSRLVNN